MIATYTTNWQPLSVNNGSKASINFNSGGLKGNSNNLGSKANKLNSYSHEIGENIPVTSIGSLIILQ